MNEAYNKTRVAGMDQADDVQILARGITRRYGQLKALDNLTLQIKQGEFLTLLGPSGSGKSTFLNILAGFDKPTEGVLNRRGADITHLPVEKRNFGMVFQGYALFPHLTAARNVAFPLRVRGVPSDEQKARVRSALELVGLGSHVDKLPSQLSGGQQQRVALARALVFSPDILLLDEPLSALDKALREQMQMEFQRIHRETGTTFVFVTHDQSEALALSSRIAIFNHGALMQVGSPEDVYLRPANRFVAEFLGQINLFSLAGAQAQGGVVTGRFDDVELRVPGDASGNVLLGVRPERMQLSHGKLDLGNAVPVVVAGTAYHGSTLHLSLSTHSADRAPQFSYTIATEAWSKMAAGPGERLWLNWALDAGIVVSG